MKDITKYRMMRNGMTHHRQDRVQQRKITWFMARASRNPCSLHGCEKTFASMAATSKTSASDILRISMLFHPLAFCLGKAQIFRFVFFCRF